MQGMTSARRRWRPSAAAALGVALALLAGCEEQPRVAAQQAQEAPPPAVTVAVVREQEVNEPFEFVGRAEARQTVDLRARVQGFLQERRFEEGEDVQTGQVLFVIDPSRYQAQLASARARLSRAEAPCVTPNGTWRGPGRCTRAARSPMRISTTPPPRTRGRKPRSRPPGQVCAWPRSISRTRSSWHPSTGASAGRWSRSATWSGPSSVRSPASSCWIRSAPRSR